VLHQNPLNGMAALRSPVHIMKSGRLVGVV
jgi:hypothetical protein